jgi:hypothetical protein
MMVPARVILFRLTVGGRKCYESNDQPTVEPGRDSLFLGGQWSIILGYRRLSVKSLLVFNNQE